MQALPERPVLPAASTRRAMAAERTACSSSTPEGGRKVRSGRDDPHAASGLEGDQRVAQPLAPAATRRLLPGGFGLFEHVRLAEEAGVASMPPPRLGAGRVDLAAAETASLGLTKRAEVAAGHALADRSETFVEVQKMLVRVVQLVDADSPQDASQRISRGRWGKGFA